MMLFICSVRDSAAQAFGRPFFVSAIGQALRSFMDEVNRVDANNDLNKHPGDFELFHLGTFDDNTGVVSSLPQPQCYARGKDVLQPKE